MRRPACARSSCSARFRTGSLTTFRARVAGRTWKGRYRGQRQKWFAVRFTGKDSEINVEKPGGGHKAEFVSWRWEPMKNLTGLIVPFKRPVYERVVKEFSALARD